MLDREPTGGPGAIDSAPTAGTPTEVTPPRRRRTTKRTAEEASAPDAATTDTAPAPEEAAPAKKTARKIASRRTTKSAASAEGDSGDLPELTEPATRAGQTATKGEVGQAGGLGESTPVSPPEPAAEPAEVAPTAAPAKRTRKTAAATAATKTTTRTARPRKSTKATPSPEPAPEAVAVSGEPPSAPPEQSFVPPEQPSVAPAVAPPRMVTPPPTVMFVAPSLDQAFAATGPDESDEPAAPARRRRSRSKSAEAAPQAERLEPTHSGADAAQPDTERNGEIDSADGDSAERRRRRRGRRGKGKGKNGAEDNHATETAEASGTSKAGEAEPDRIGAERSDVERSESDAPPGDGTETVEGGTRRRRRRRRRGSVGDVDVTADDDPPDTVVHVREGRSAEDEVQSVRGSTRLEAKRQRRRDGREQGRRRPPILTEAEFLARREAVDRVMVVRQRGERTQIAVLEDGVLVEHYISRGNSTSYAGNVYLGRVQNVLPSMEAAFVDIGKGRNAVLYAGEVNWDAAGLDGKPRQIEQALKSGDTLVVQVTKEPIGHKGARLTSQVSLPGRYLVYVPGGSMTGISRKLPDTERQRLKDILKRIVPEDAGVIIRTAAEGASEEELSRDVARLQAQWEVIRKKAGSSSTSVPSLLYAEPDLAIRVVRDIFNEDFGRLVVSGDEAWETLEQYVAHVAPDLLPRLHRHTAETDVFAEYRIDEQLAKALDRKVWLPSGGSLIIDRTEAMTVIDVNTGKFTGSKNGSSLEETVTRNNLEAAEEIVRQLRLRDIGGIIVIDFIDMVLESNRELVLRRLTECLGRDRTKHQVAEVTSLGLVQMTRKRVGQGLLEAFSEPCEVCRGRGVIVHTEPVEDVRRRVTQTDAGKRRRGRVAEVTEVTEAVREPAAGPAGRPDSGPSPEDVEVAAAQAAGVPDEAVQPSAGVAEETEVEQAPRRRRRRAATRPAGPPTATGVGHVDSASA